MRKVLLFLMIFYTVSAFGQAGKYAGNMKLLINKSYKNIEELALLKQWKYHSSTLLSLIDDVELITATVYQKNTTQIVIYAIAENDGDEVYTIADVIQLNNVLKSEELGIGVCRRNAESSSFLAALYNYNFKPSHPNYIKNAWRFNPDKRKIELIPKSGIDCTIDGLD